MIVKQEIQLIVRQLFQFKKIGRVLIFAIFPAILFYFIAIYILQQQGFQTVEIIRDLAQSADVSSFLGFISNMGVWMWVSAGSICFFARFSDVKILDRKQRELLLLLGFFSVLLAVDDFFMLHDRYINQKLMYAVYALLASGLLVRNLKLILAIDGFAFLLAVGTLGGSIITDLLQFVLKMPYSTQQLLEECFKFIGAATWLYFCCKTAMFRKTD
ncbi:MAG: hypothetical protein RLY16_2958 [Bacteroidota bacterium]